MTEIGKLTFYFGATRGSCQTALRQLREPDVMLSAVTQNNTRWGNIEDLFIDSGGYSMMCGMGEYEMSADEYLDYVDKVDATRFVLMDYPCEPHVLERTNDTVTGHQWKTIEAHAEVLARTHDRGINAKPIAVIQGWDKHEYIEHIDMLRDHGLLTSRVGIGSICRRGKTDTIREIILAVREAVPSNHELHGFGVKQTVLNDDRIQRALDSADSSAWDYDLYQHKCGSEPLWHTAAREYLKYKATLIELLETPAVDDEQSRLVTEQKWVSAND